MSGLLIPNTFDPKGKTPQLFFSQTTNAQVDVCNITGSGYLTSIDIGAYSAQYNLITIIVDGVTVYSGIGAYASDYHTWISTIRFNNSLRIYHYGYSSSVTSRVYVSVLLD